MDLFSLLPFTNSKKKSKHHQSGAGAPRKDRTSRRPELEPLEDRMLLSGNVISGHVYHDVNGNGIFDQGDTPIANSPLELRNEHGVVIGTTVSDANGFYMFNHDATVDTSNAMLEQTVVIDPTTAGFSLTRLVDQFDPSMGQLLEVQIINEGSITSDIRAENTSTHVGATITGIVSGKISLVGPGFVLESVVSENAGSFEATAFDGTIDFGGTSGMQFTPQTAVADAKSVTLTGAQVNPFIGTGQVQFTETVEVYSTATGGGNILIGINSEATAAFKVRYVYTPANGLQPGEYTVVQLEQPLLADGVTPYLDGPEYQNGVLVPNSIGKDEIKVTLTGTDSINNDFTEIPPASLAGYVYLDANNDGIKQTDLLPNSQPREPGIADVTVFLTGTDDTGATVSQVTTTGADGFYKFDVLRPGTYAIEEVQPTAYLKGIDTIGSAGGNVEHNKFTDIALTGGVQGVDYNFGELIAADMSIVKAATPDPVLAGGTVTYTMTVSNLGPHTAQEVRVEDTLPPELTFLDVIAPGWEVQNQGGQLIFTRDSMLNGSVSTIQIIALAPIFPGDYFNTATVTTTTYDINLTNNQSTAKVTVPPVAISPEPPPILPPDNPPPQNPPPQNPPPQNNDTLSKALILSSSDFWFQILNGK